MSNQATTSETVLVEIVCELIPEIVTWNKGPLAVLVGHPLPDGRVRVWSNSVVDFIAKGDLKFDALLLDTDNGPDCVVHVPNQIYINPRSGNRCLGCSCQTALPGFGRRLDPKIFRLLRTAKARSGHRLP